MLVEIFDDVVHLIKVQLGVGKSEIAPERNHDVVASVHVSQFIDVVLKFLRFCWRIEGIKFFIIDQWFVVEERDFVVPKALRPAIVILHDTCENLLLVSKVLRKRPPQIVQ